MDESTIIEVLKKWNPWEKRIDAGIEREIYIEKIYPYLGRKEVIMLKGIRRCGKSTIVKQLISKLMKDKADKNQILYLNLEDYNFANELRIDLFEAVLSAYRNYSKNKNKIYFFIDEIQKIDGWEKWIRTKYDLNEDTKFIVTGSSASLLSREFSTLLTGRNLSFKIMPLSFKEFVKFSKNKSLKEYLEFGGFPEVVLEQSEEKKMLLLRQYFEDIVHKDVVARYSIRNAKQLIEIARYLVSATGSKVSLNKLSKVFGISKDTLSQYIGYMIDAFLLFEVTYFSYSAKIRHDVTKLPKLYALDNGLINAVSIKYSGNIGRIFENTVLIKLLEKFEEVHYWSELKSEVDFIVDKIALNITATDKIHEREMQGLMDFQKRNKGFSSLIITQTKTENNMLSILNFLSQ